MKKSAGCEWDFRQKGKGKRYYKALNLSYISENIFDFFMNERPRKPPDHNS